MRPGEGALYGGGRRRGVRDPDRVRASRPRQPKRGNGPRPGPRMPCSTTLRGRRRRGPAPPRAAAQRLPVSAGGGASGRAHHRQSSTNRRGAPLRESKAGESESWGHWRRRRSRASSLAEVLGPGFGPGRGLEPGVTCGPSNGGLRWHGLMSRRRRCRWFGRRR